MFVLLFTAALVGVLALLLRNHPIAILEPAGQIAREQKNLLVFGTALSLFVVLPVFGLTIFIVWKYRESNKTARYMPNWDHNRKLEAVWWLLPAVLITILSVITWRTSHSLDPFKPIVSDKKPVKVQVIALDWKWLFIYPEERVATVNYLQIPVDTPVDLQITADAPMNSLWIPQLAGQVYAMTGMSTELHIMADKKGSYQGVSANISGSGFAGMRFTVTATDEKEYADWITMAKQTNEILDKATYGFLAQPSSYETPKLYALGERNLYDTVVHKYAGHGTTHMMERGY